MKLTDMAILFVVIAWCFFSRILWEDDLLQEQIFGIMMDNNIMDNVAEDALSHAADIDNGEIVVDREALLSEVTKQVAADYMGEKDSYGEYLKNQICLLVFSEPDGYYIAGRRRGEEFTWTDKIFYSKGSVTPQEEKVNAVLEESYEKFGVMLFLPNGEDTGLIKTISDYQFLMVYETQGYEWRGEKYSKLLLSGAKVEQDVVFTK